MAFYAGETEAHGFVTDARNWHELKAKTLTAAKREASISQLFQGTTLHVCVGPAGCSAEEHYYCDPENFVTVAVKRADPLDMSRPGSWKNIDKVASYYYYPTYQPNKMGHGS